MTAQPIAVSLIPFSFESHSVRIINKHGEIWFVAADVCTAIDIGTEQIRRLDEDEKGLHLTQTLGGKQEMSVINESGLYALILRSRKPTAKRFRKWVTSEVLPAIRKTGQYRQQPELDFTDISAMKSAREIAFKYFDDFRAAVKAGKDFAPMDDIPSAVLAGMVSAALRQRQFVLSFDHNGKLCIRPMPDPYDGLAKAIADPGNIGLEDQVISEIGHACMTALASRAKCGKSAIGRARSGDNPQS